MAASSGADGAGPSICRWPNTPTRNATAVAAAPPGPDMSRVPVTACGTICSSGSVRVADRTAASVADWLNPGPDSTENRTLLVATPDEASLPERMAWRDAFR